MALLAKKTIIINILNILRKYTDREHTLSQKDIVDKMLSEYEMEVNRKTVKRNIDELMEMGYDIEYREVPRTSFDKKTGEEVEANIISDYYINREFDDSELRVMITSILAARNMRYKNKKDIVRKLEQQSSIHFKKQTTSLSPSSNDENINNDIFLAIEVIEEAMRENKQIYINYADYKTDKKLHMRPTSWDPDLPKRYRINPYYIVNNEARLYLICSTSNQDGVHLNTYRLDKIKNPKIIDDSNIVPKSEVKELGQDFNLSTFMANNFIMVPSDPITFTMRINKKMFLNELFDTFTGDFEFFDDDKDGDFVSVRATAGYNSIKIWAVRFAEGVKILSPQNLVDDVKNTLRKALENYGE